MEVSTNSSLCFIVALVYQQEPVPPSDPGVNPNI